MNGRMGITYVDAEVSNEAGLSRLVHFLVGSGAAYSSRRAITRSRA
jgi:hypothetical protein